MSASASQVDPELQRVFDIWAEYQKTHDVSALHGKPVGVDPIGGGVWIGDSGREVADRARAEGVERVIVFRVGLGYYLRKGGLRRTLRNGFLSSFRTDRRISDGTGISARWHVPPDNHCR